MTEPGKTPRPLLSADGKLYAVAVIAIVYLIAWYGVSTVSPPPSAAASPATPAVATVPAAPRAVWIDQLPAAERPNVAPPAGWRLAARNEQTAAPVLRRAPASRPVRVRTRSS